MSKEIQSRLDRGYTMAVYGTSENIHRQMTEDIETLLKAINHSRRSLQSKDKETISFDEWKKRHLTDMNQFDGTFLHDTKGWIDECMLIDEYNKEVMNL